MWKKSIDWFLFIIFLVTVFSFLKDIALVYTIVAFHKVRSRRIQEAVVVVVVVVGWWRLRIIKNLRNVVIGGYCSYCAVIGSLNFQLQEQLLSWRSCYTLVRKQTAFYLHERIYGSSLKKILLFMFYWRSLKWKVIVA